MQAIFARMWVLFFSSYFFISFALSHSLASRVPSYFCPVVVWCECMYNCANSSWIATRCISAGYIFGWAFVFALSFLLTRWFAHSRSNSSHTSTVRCVGEVNERSATFLHILMYIHCTVVGCTIVPCSLTLQSLPSSLSSFCLLPLQPSSFVWPVCCSILYAKRIGSCWIWRSL